MLSVMLPKNRFRLRFPLVEVGVMVEMKTLWSVFVLLVWICCDPR
jgi:hypothetical protein